MKLDSLGENTDSQPVYTLPLSSHEHTLHNVSTCKYTGCLNTHVSSFLHVLLSFCLKLKVLDLLTYSPSAFHQSWSTVGVDLVQG